MNGELKNVTDDPSLRGRNFVFRDRVQAGTLLAEQLKPILVQPVVILAIPRGGIPVACTISEELAVAFDLVVSRKIPLPYTREAGYGAVTWKDIVVVNTALTAQLQLTENEMHDGIVTTKQQVEEQTIRYRGDTALPNPRDKTVVLVDDGIASGYTMLAAIKYVQQGAPWKIVIAVPTAPSRSLQIISPVTDHIICLNVRDTPYFAVADAYLNWQDVPENTALAYLKNARHFMKEGVS